MFIRKLGIVASVLLLVSLLNLRVEVVAKGLEIEHQPVKLKGYLKKDYSAYIFDIKNDTDSDVKVYDIDYSGDRPVGSATNDAQSGGQASLGILWGFALGFFWLLIPVAIAIIATPIILIKRSGTRKSTRKELAKFEPQAPREAVIKAHSTEQVVAIFPKLQRTTTLKLSYKDLVSGTVAVFDEQFSLSSVAN